MEKKKLNFIVVDDSKLDCFIAEKIIRNSGTCESIKSFLQAKEALEYIVNTPANRNVILLVDIAMPGMSGFEFVEAFEMLSKDITKNYTIYMLSPSLNVEDIARARRYPVVKRFLNKPLTLNNLVQLLL